MGRDRWGGTGGHCSWGDESDESEGIGSWWREEEKDQDTEKDMFVLACDDNRGYARIYIR